MTSYLREVWETFATGGVSYHTSHSSYVIFIFGLFLRGLHDVSWCRPAAGHNITLHYLSPAFPPHCSHLHDVALLLIMWKHSSCHQRNFNLPAIHYLLIIAVQKLCCGMLFSFCFHCNDWKLAALNNKRTALSKALLLVNKQQGNDGFGRVNATNGPLCLVYMIMTRGTNMLTCTRLMLAYHRRFFITRACHFFALLKSTFCTSSYWTSASLALYACTRPSYISYTDFPVPYPFQFNNPSSLYTVPHPPPFCTLPGDTFTF